jgi:hypothetical protein
MIPLIELPLLKVIAAILILVVSVVGYEDVHLYLKKHPASAKTQQSVKKNTPESHRYIYIKQHLLRHGGLNHAS